ncbi:5-oxoprolinase subunit PxpA [Vibrio gallicus]|uniref:5-oxoprolinase subunit PxpA n=1 Tax=Vibrio gallicus TaxID=190897 RepID=UPI0021C480D4|nr:5-oxoprolinase subunit PxpA [Vibrio gallicus]
MNLNCDMGESFSAWTMGQDQGIMPYIDMANIACGFHASDPDVMQTTVRLAQQHKVSIGAHPSYHDLHGFGRRSIPHTSQQITNAILYQVGALNGICALYSTAVSYIKPHGALYNDMMTNIDIYQAILRAATTLDLPLMVLATPNVKLDQLAQQCGVTLIKEAFLDRRYLANGLLVPRSHPNAVLHDWNEIEQQMKGFVMQRITASDGTSIPIYAQSLCIHGDNPNAMMIASKARLILDAK